MVNSVKLEYIRQGLVPTNDTIGAVLEVNPDRQKNYFTTKQSKYWGSNTDNGFPQCPGLDLDINQTIVMKKSDIENESHNIRSIAYCGKIQQTVNYF